jgi:hypothetical protein
MVVCTCASKLHLHVSATPNSYPLRTKVKHPCCHLTIMLLQTFAWRTRSTQWNRHGAWNIIYLSLSVNITFWLSSTRVLCKGSHHSVTLLLYYYVVGCSSCVPAMNEPNMCPLMAFTIVDLTRRGDWTCCPGPTIRVCARCRGYSYARLKRTATS